MSSLRSLITIAFLPLLLAGVFVVSSDSADATTTQDFKLGVFLENPGDLGNFENDIGRSIDIFHFFYAVGDDFNAGALRSLSQQGKTIMVTWEPWDPGAADPVNQPDYQLQNITSGNFDGDIHRWARQLRDFGYPIRFRPMPEMNGNWTVWSGIANGNQPSDFIPAWRHIHDIFVQEGATNVEFVWSPNVNSDSAGAAATFNTYYPGDAYVDYLGLDGYNWGTTQNTPEWTSLWQDFTAIFGPSYDEFTVRTAKPVMVCETASAELGGSKPGWITDTFARLPVRFPRIESLVWFNTNKETDWRVNSSPGSLEAFRNAVKAPDVTAPTVSIGSPLPGASLSNTVTVVTAASDNDAVSKVELYVGDDLAGVRTAEPYDFDLATGGFASGSHVLKAVAYDASGNAGIAEIGIVIDNNFGIAATDIYWSSYADYQSGELSVDYKVTSQEVFIQELTIVGSIESSGAAVTTPLPLATGIVDPGSQGSSFTLKYSIPRGVGSFRSTLFAIAMAGSGETYLIPAPYPGA